MASRYKVAPQLQRPSRIRSMSGACGIHPRKCEKRQKSLALDGLIC